MWKMSKHLNEYFINNFTGFFFIKVNMLFYIIDVFLLFSN